MGWVHEGGPAVPPFEREVAIVVGLAAEFPVDVDGADGFGAEDAGFEAVAGGRKQEDGRGWGVVVGEID